MKFEDYGLSIISDFEIRILRENEDDMDLLIPINHRALNLVFCELPDYLKHRFQVNNIYGILIRIAKHLNNDATIHILRNIDLDSSFLNFEICYDNHLLNIKDCTSFIELIIDKRKECPDCSL